MTGSIVILCSLALICFYAAVKLRYQLHMLQQNSYRTGRYWRWLRQQKSNEAMVDNVTDALMGGILGGFFNSPWRIYAVAALALICMYKGVRLLRKRSKKPLVFTARAVRLYAVALAVVAAVVAAIALSLGAWWGAAAAIVLAVCAPCVVCIAVWILAPVEALINRRYLNDAKRILRSMPRLVVIGITGSYGKTSTKHYLHRILSERFNVVMTPGSFNTTLGVVRTVREHLKPYHEVFIVEMGAKQIGDVAEICDLVHPSIGIITAVGEQHLESFKTIENVRRTKFELIDALPPDGVAILNDDFEPVADRPVHNVARVYRYSTNAAEANGNYLVTDVKYGRDRTTFRIANPEGVESAPFTTRLAGIHNLSNILAGYIAGRTLGMTEDEMRYAISRIEQVEHRLSITRVGGMTIIDDAFNSNPHGAAMALDVLAGFTEGRRMVVTPGMIELGPRQRELNCEFGRRMAAACDYAIIVGEYNREAILEGLAEGDFDAGKIYAARDFADAVARVRTTARPGDTILYENDLPDTFK